VAANEKDFRRFQIDAQDRTASVFLHLK